jgi:hypothetical protein
MSKGRIWDDRDGSHLANIEDGKVFRVTDNCQIGTIRDGNIYGLDGKLLGHLQGMDASRGQIPEDFRKLAKASDG